MAKENSRTWAAVLAAAFMVIGAGSGGDGRPLVIKAGKIITVSGGTIEAGVIIVKDGRIIAVGSGLSAPKDAEVITIPGGWVYPGFIDALTDLGASDKPSIEKDSDEASSPLTPQLRILDAVDPANEFLGRARRMGTTTVLAAPALGNLLSGQSALLRLAGEDASGMIVKFPVAVHGALGEPAKLRYGAKGQAPMTRMGAAALLRQTFIDARNYLDEVAAYEKKVKDYEQKEKDGKAGSDPKPSPPAANSMYQALIPVVKGEIPLCLHADRMDDIMTALRIAEEHNLRLIIEGGAEAYKVADRLAAKKIPIILRPRDAFGLTLETEKACFENAALLDKAGVPIAFQTGSTSNFGDLIPQAQAAVAHGLPARKALEALTIGAARILGASGELGSVEKGKTADLVVFDGDPLRGPAKVRLVVIGGRVIEDLR